MDSKRDESSGTSSTHNDSKPPFAISFGGIVSDLMHRPLQEEIQYLNGREGVRNLFQSLSRDVSEDVRLVFPSVSALNEYYFVLEDLVGVGAKLRKRNQHPKVRVLLSSPINEEGHKNASELQALGLTEWRKTEPIDIGIAIYDNSKLVLFQPVHQEDRGESSSATTNAETAILISNRFIVTAITAFFNVFWKESELRETGDIARRELVEALAREERAKREAQLLQDILTHDIRNYNQVTKLSVELLKEELKDKESVQMILGSMLNAIEGSTDLLERAKRLGRVISEQNPRLYSVNLIEIIENSLDVIRRAYPEKVIRHERSITRIGNGQPEIYAERRVVEKEGRRSAEIVPPPAAANVDSSYCTVLADDLLNEVFANLFSNSVKYSDGKEVCIEVSISQVPESEPLPLQGALVEGSASRPTLWKITVTDNGHGIPDQSKAEVFSRYLRGARGTGLGMSIVHALIVDRYRGKISVRNRVADDYSKGTSIDIWLKSADWQ